MIVPSKQEATNCHLYLVTWVAGSQ